MKVLVPLFSLLFFVGMAQAQTASTAPKQQADVGIKGNNNIVTVIQSDKEVIYNLQDKKQYQQFLNYLKTISGFTQDLDKILQYNSKTFAMITQAIESGVFNLQDFLKKTEEYIRENERLKIENEQLKKLTTDQDFKKALEEATKRLDVYDNDGYQEILQHFIVQNEKKLNRAEKESADAAYLQAKNNYINFSPQIALEQVNKALNYNQKNINYLFLKAHVLDLLTRFNESINIFEKVLAIAKDDTLKASCYNKIGLAYEEKGNYDKAITYYDSALSLREQIVGSEDPDIAEFYNNMGSVYMNKRNFDKALEYYSKALAIHKKISGAESEEIACSYNNMGTAYEDKLEFNKALEFYSRSLAIQERLSDKTHSDLATAYHNMGSIYNDIGDYDKALKYYDKTLAIKEKIYGSEHPRTAVTYNNIGLVYSNKQDTDKALEFFNKALRIWERTLGQGHPKTVASYHNIGLTLYEKGEYDKALECLNKALVIQEKVLGKDHPNTVSTYGDIGMVYKEKGDFKTALHYYNTVLAIYEKSLRDRHDDIAALYFQNGVLLILTGDKKKGMACLEQTNYAADQLIDLLNRQAINLSTSKGEESMSLFVVAQELLEKMNVPKTSATRVIVYQNLAMAHCYNGQKDEAMPLFEKALSIAKSIKNDKYIEGIIKNIEDCKRR